MSGALSAISADVRRGAAATPGERFSLAILTSFGLGLAPVAPGTFGTLGGVAIHGLLVALGAGQALALAAAAAVFFLATCALGRVAQRRYGTKDPQRVVSDEVAGYLAAVAGVGSATTPFFAVALPGFVLFRILDIAKPWPIGRLERLPGGLGIAADDLAAGLVANLVLRGAFALAGAS